MVPGPMASLYAWVDLVCLRVEVVEWNARLGVVRAIAIPQSGNHAIDDSVTVVHVNVETLPPLHVGFAPSWQVTTPTLDVRGVCRGLDQCRRFLKQSCGPTHRGHRQ